MVQAPEGKLRTDVTQLQGVPRAKQEVQILGLIEMGETIQAVKVVKSPYGLSTTEAKTFVNELQES